MVFDLGGDFGNENLNLFENGLYARLAKIGLLGFMTVTTTLLAIELT